MGKAYIDRLEEKFVVKVPKTLFGSEQVRAFASYRDALEFATEKAGNAGDVIDNAKPAGTSLEALDLLFKRRPGEAPVAVPDIPVRPRLAAVPPTYVKYPFKTKWQPGFDDFFRAKKIFLSPVFSIGGVYGPDAEISINSQVFAEEHATLVKHSFFSIGSFSYSNSKFPSTTTVGRFCSLAGGIRTMGPGHPTERVTTSTVTYGKYFSEYVRKNFDSEFKPLDYESVSKPVTIGNDVWIGDDVLLAGGITIGNGAVVAARSIVTRDVPPYSVVAGSPAKVRKFRFREDIIERLLAVQWWKYSVGDLPRSWDNVENFLDEIEIGIERGSIELFAPKPVDIALELTWLVDQNKKK
jgi:acetyltransferase-like isoleucine patch superfamily enzyme